MGKLQQFNYSRSLITNRGTVERGKIHSARAMKQNTQTWRAASKRMCFLELIVCQELARQDNWPRCKELLLDFTTEIFCTPYSDAYELISRQTNYLPDVSIQRNKTL